MKHDVTTSLSDVRVPDELKTVAEPDHSYRRIEYARRREYVDSSTCVPSLCSLSNAQIQTEPRETSVVEIQVSEIRDSLINDQIFRKSSLLYSKTNFPLKTLTF